MTNPYSYAGATCIGKTQLFYPPEGAGKKERLALEIKAKELCAQCPHLEHCRDQGIKNENYGIWGGLNSLELSEERRVRKITLRRIAIWADRPFAGYKIAYGDFDLKVHNNCGTVKGYHELAAKARMLGGAEMGYRITCQPCKDARSQYEAELRKKKRKGV